jgi:hypothetical protein
MRRRLLAIAVAGLAFSLAVPAVHARDYDYDRERWGYGNRRSDDFGRYRPGGAGIVDRTMSDLRRAASRNRVDSHERDHFRRAVNELQTFRYRLAEGRFDEGRLNRAIEDLEHLSNARQLHPADRRILAQDMYELRDFRRWAARGGYRY